LSACLFGWILAAGSPSFHRARHAVMDPVTPIHRGTRQLKPRPDSVGSRVGEGRGAGRGFMLDREAAMRASSLPRGKRLQRKVYGKAGKEVKKGVFVSKPRPPASFCGEEVTGCQGPFKERGVTDAALKALDFPSLPGMRTMPARLVQCPILGQGQARRQKSC
jgi:hypothetical protein